MSGCLRQRAFSEFRSGARASELVFLFGLRNGACYSPSPINAYRVELALCLCFCLTALNEKRGQRGALVANIGNRDNLPEGGARERADGEQPA